MLEPTTFPIMFSVDDDFDNDKFLKLRLKVCHDARSLHNTMFTKDSLLEAESTISNIPILAHVIENDDGELDIGAHDIVIEKDRYDEDKSREIFLEQPVGVIPETNNYEVVEENGISYVYCDGYIWKGYSNYCIDILKNSDRIKLSMEVDFQNYHYSRADDCYKITKYKYLGITLLGSESKPAMQNSGATIVNYSAEDDPIYSPTVEEMCSEISKVFSVTDTNIQKGEDTMDTETKQSILDELGVTEDELDFEITDDMTEETLRAKIKEYLNKKDSEESDEGGTEGETNTKESNHSVKDNTITFALSDEDKRSAIYRALEELGDDEYWIAQTYDDCVIVESWLDSKYYKIGYSKTDDAITLDSEFVEVFAEFITAEEKAELEQLRNDYAALETETAELRQYKSETESAARETALNSVFEKFDEKLGECEDYNSLKESNSDYSVDEIEEKCYAILGKMNSTFSANTGSEPGVNRIVFSQHTENTDVDRKPYGGLFEAFNKD